jgi:prolyl-tRNA editing enzyme YbaK/EbsC (Cys-tRNA(Pro) deacylase)
VTKPESADSIRRVEQALAAAGVAARIVELPQSARTAKDAAAAIGCRVEQIAKSLVFRLADSGEPVLVVASGPNRVDEKLIASYLDGEIVKADADFVRATTGYVIGGVPPLGHATPLRTLVDSDLEHHEVIWAAAGTPQAVFSADPRQLIPALGGRVVAVKA